MKTAQDVMTKEVVSIDAHAAVAEAIQRMRDLGVGSLLVERVSPSDTWGIISQTDVVQKVMALDKDLSRVKVAEVMSKPIAIVRPDTPLRDCARLMARDHIRRVFVFDGHDIIGVVSASDIFRTL